MRFHLRHFRVMAQKPRDLKFVLQSKCMLTADFMCTEP